MKEVKSVNSKEKEIEHTVFDYYCHQRFLAFLDWQGSQAETAKNL